MVNTIKNIRSRKSIIREMKRLRSLHSLMTNNIAASVIIQNNTGQITFCSPYTEVLTGYPVDEIVAMCTSNENFLEPLVIETDQERYKRAIQVSHLGEDIMVRYRMHHKSGLMLWLETRMVPICDKNGDVSAVMAVTIDVSDTLNYQGRIEEQNRDLSDFASMVSHDLKAPIFTIKGMASAFIEDFGSNVPTEGIDMLNHIIDATKRLEKLIASVIEYSSLSSKEINQEPVPLQLVISQVTADLTELIKQKKAEFVIPSNLPAVPGEQVRIYQVFSNLFSNALKYSSPERLPKVVVQFAKDQRGQLVVRVKDNCQGIPTNKLDDIFRPYHRAHSADIEGSGIGLACVKKIMQKLGGEVSVQSTLGEGSTFILIFPPLKLAPREIPKDLERIF